MNLCQLLTATARKEPDRILCICGDRQKTAAELLARVSALANALTNDLAVRPGHSVALAAHNSDLYLEVVLAVMAVGAVIAPVNWRWSLQARSCMYVLCQGRKGQVSPFQPVLHCSAGCSSCT